MSSKNKAGLLENIIKDNGIEFDNHESDLYIFSTPQTIELFGLNTYNTFRLFVISG